MIEWRTVPSFPWFEASSDGRIRRRLESIDRRRTIGREVVGSKNAKGYIMVSFSYGTIRYSNFGKHVLVCEAFHGRKPSPDHEVLHGDGVPNHNVPTNLRWGTPQENADDRKRHGRNHRGNQHGMAKLSPDDVFEVRRLRAMGFRGHDVAALINANKDHINKIAAWTSRQISSEGCDNAILSFGG